MAASAVTGQSVSDMAAQMAKAGDTVEPDPELVEEYAKISSVHEELYDALAGVFPRLQELRQ